MTFLSCPLRSIAGLGSRPSRLTPVRWRDLSEGRPRGRLCGPGAVGGCGSGVLNLVEFVEEATSLFFIGGVPPFNKCEPVGAAESGHQNSLLALLLCAVLVAGRRDADGELGVDLGTVVGGEAEAVKCLVAVLIEPEAVSERVDRLAAAAKIGKNALTGLALDALAFDQLSDEHATYVVAVGAAPPPDEHIF